jgi:hypothetical protein
LLHKGADPTAVERRRFLWLLRTRRQRPSGCRAAEQRDELASSYVVASLARAGGNVTGLSSQLSDTAGHPDRVRVGGRSGGHWLPRRPVGLPM